MVNGDERVGRAEGDIAQAVREGRLEKSEGVRQIATVRRARFTGGALGERREAPGIIEGATGAELTAQQIEQQKRDILARGGRTSTKRSKDVRTGERLEIIETRGRGGSLIRETKNLDTGKTRINVFGVPRGGGSVALRRGVIIQEEVTPSVDIPGLVDADIKTIKLPKNIRNVLIKDNEIFNPNLNAFVRPSDPSGQATGFIRTPTISEQRIINIAEKKGSLVGILTFIAEKEAELELKLFGERKPGAPTSAEQRAALKEQFPPIRIFEFGAEGFLRAGEKLAGSKAPAQARQTAKVLLEDILVFSVFSGAIKTATAQQLESQFVYDNVKKKFVKKSELSTIQAQTEFARMTPERQTEILKLAFKNRVYLDQVSLQKDILKAANFMKRSGLTNDQIGNQLLRLFPGQSSTVIQQTTLGIELPQLAQLEQLPAVLTAVRVGQGSAKNQEMIRQAQLTPEQRFAERQLGISRFQAISEVGSDSRFSVISISQDSKLRRLQKNILQTRQQINQATNPVQRQNLLNRQKLNVRQMIQIDQRQSQLVLQRNNQSLRLNTVQLQRLKSQQASLTRQLSATTNVQRQQLLTRQIQATKTAQDSLTRQVTKQTTLQKSLTKQISKLKTKLKGVSTKGIGKPFKPKKIKLPTLFGIKKKKIKKRRGFITKPKKFQVFVRKKGQDILFKSFKTKRKARIELKKRLSTTLRASGFIFDKKRGVKIKPKITKGFRLGKRDKFRIVEKRNLRLDTKIETSSIQKARKLKKSFNGKSNFKKVKSIKLKRRKK